MRRIRTTVFACAALAAVSGGSASAGIVTVTVRDDGTNSPTGGCTQRPASSPWQFIAQAAGSICDFKLRINAVPGSRAGDIVSAHAVARLNGVATGFRVGLLARSGNALAGAVPVPHGDHVVTTAETATPLQTSSGSLTLDLRSIAGAGEVWVGPRTTRSVVLRVMDTSPPHVLGPITTVPADVAVASVVAVGARFTDNGPITRAPVAVVHWGDGTSSRLSTSVPSQPFSAGMTTRTAAHAYAVPGFYKLTVDVVDTAGNVAHGRLGRLRAWGPPTNTSPPRVLGAMKVGATVRCTTGRWHETGGPVPYTFRWLRGKAVIAGAAGSIYTLTVTDRNRQMACRVVARNVLGRAAAAVSPVRRLWVAPVLVKRPRIKGHARAGSRITCNTGVWRWSPRKFRIIWLRDHRRIKSHSQRLKLRGVDRGATFQCRVTASNPAGRALASSRTIRVKR